MKIKKTNGNYQAFSPNKILNRIKAQCKDLPGVNPDLLFQRIIPSISDGMTTTQIDEILAYKAADLIVTHPDYSLLGGRILMTRQAKRLGVECQPVDLAYDLFGAVTFLKKYSMLDDNELPTELPSMMYERVGRFLGDDDKEAEAFVEALKSRKVSLATPILTNAGTGRKSMISCNLSVLTSDTLEGIQDTLTSMAKASKDGAGIGLLVDPLRSKESLVSTFKGKAGGLVRLADMVQACMRFYKQGSRSGSCALYMSVWHRDIMDFLELRLPVGDEKLRARDLFTAVVVNDNFMTALVEGRDWYLFCPNDIVKAGLRPLYDLWGEEYEKEYEKAVALGIGFKISPKKIWDAIIRSQVESGTPYVFYKDNANRSNMQDNIGVIKQSNLCVAGDTLLLTKEGQRRIHEVEGKFVDAWNGEEWSRVLVRRTGVDKELVTVMFDDGSKIVCTPEHTFWLDDDSKKEAKALSVGDEIQSTLPGNRHYDELVTRVVTSVNGRLFKEDVFCAHEPKRNRLTFNNIVTGNCIEIVEVSMPGYTAQCTLGLVNLKENDTPQEVFKSAGMVARMLNRVIDKNVFPDEYADRAGRDQRAIAVGVAGLADFFAKKSIPFASEEAKKLNVEIFRALYLGAFNESSLMGEVEGNYPAWEGSKYEQGSNLLGQVGEGDQQVPMRNSLLVALMPSASTSILLGAQECFEPYTSNVFVRSTGAGEFMIINKYLVNELEEIGLWNEQIAKQIVYNEGSVQDIAEIPQRIKDVFKTVWEIPQKEIITMAADRQKFIDQSQSMNLYFADADYGKISGALRYAWQSGLKTGVYYTRTQRKSEKPKRLFAAETPAKKPIDSPFECFGCSS